MSKDIDQSKWITIATIPVKLLPLLLECFAAGLAGNVDINIVMDEEINENI